MAGSHREPQSPLSGARAVAERRVAALNEHEHDLDGATDCFAIDYHDKAPARRSESVDAQQAVRRNFHDLFSQLPDLEAAILRSVVDGDTLWMEWRMRGTRRDGSSMEFVGLNIFGVAGRCFRRGWICTELARAGGTSRRADAAHDRGGE